MVLAKRWFQTLTRNAKGQLLIRIIYAVSKENTPVFANPLSSPSLRTGKRILQLVAPPHKVPHAVPVSPETVMEREFVDVKRVERPKPRIWTFTLLWRTGEKSTGTFT